MAKEFAEPLRQVVTEEGGRLRAVSEEANDERSGGEAGWPRKQELCHLLDSATNNRVRFVVGTLQGILRDRRLLLARSEMTSYPGAALGV